jgi:hypothetical protein
MIYKRVTYRSAGSGNKINRSGWNAGWHGTLALCGIAKKFRPKPYLTITEDELNRVADFLRKKRLL